MNSQITVLTPVYNRKKEIHNLYKSLLEQENKDFIWLIIDDGSQDDLSNDIEDMEKDADFPIQYIYKENGGKHTALNTGFDLIETELTFIVDSDDVLTTDAIANIVMEWDKIKNKDLAGIAFLRGYDEKRVIGKEFPSNGIFNDIDIRYRIGVSGDKAEVWRTDLLKKYKFPVFENERFQGENYIWQQIALKYNMMYINKIIYITEYLEGGLTKSGRKLRINCPLGGMENSKVGFNSKFPLKIRIKKAWLYVCYGKFAKKGFITIVKESGNALLIIPNYIFGFLLYLYWKKKYL